MTAQAKLSWDELAEQHRAGQRQTLAQRFVVPPFSVLDARQDYWRVRKQQWLSLGIKSEVGRGKHTEGELGVKNADKAMAFREFKDWMTKASTETSVFDPVLCEVMYRWFAPRDGAILDPFAGGSVRGVVAAMLQRQYTGVDLRPEQIEANLKQADEILTGRVSEQHWPTWYAGDSRKIKEHVQADGTERYDFVYTCPPYGDLEVYSDDPADLSTMSWSDFAVAYGVILGEACDLLKPDRFAAVVVGDIRDERGLYRNFPGLTTEIMLRNGLQLYNEAILVTPAGTMPVRAANQFPRLRKLTKGHQNVLVYLKGDPRKAVAALGDDSDVDAPLPLLMGAAPAEAPEDGRLL